MKFNFKIEYYSDEDAEFYTLDVVGKDHVMYLMGHYN